MSLLPLLLLPLPLSGCKAVNPAPADLDGLLHWFWQEYEPGSDEDLHAGVRNAFDIVDLDALAEDVQDGSLTRLDADEAALVGVTDRDPAEAVGLYLLSRIDCDMATLEPILWAPQQDVLYPGIYDAYDRVFTSSTEDFSAGTAATLTWDTRYTASYLGSSYDAETRGGLRRLPEIDAEISPHGEVLLQRTYMPWPSVWDSDNKEFDQDYQIEVYVDDGQGSVLHLYGLWRHAEYGSGFTSDDEGVQRLLLNGLADWDETTEALCLEGGV